MIVVVLFTAIACAGILVQSLVGFAGSLVAIPLMALFLSAKEAIPAYNLALLLVMVLLVVEARQHIHWHRVGKLMVGGLIGIPVGTYGLKHLPLNTLGLFISIVTLGFGLLLLLKIRVPLRENTPTQFAVGLLSGFLGGSISQGGPPMVIYGVARGWDKNAFRTTLVTYFMFLSILANICYAWLGLFTQRTMGLFAASVGPALLAAWIGILLKNRANESVFRNAVLAVVIAISIIGVSRYFL